VALQALRQGNMALNERYPGSAHLFADSSLADYDPQAAELLMERVLAFLREHA
jgi:dienelactone hydrolase